MKIAIVVTILVALSSFFVIGLLWSVSYAVGDSHPPEIIEFDFSPKVIDTSNSAKAIVVTARITDDLSGVYEGFNSFR